MNYRSPLFCGVTDNLAKTKGFGARHCKDPHCKKCAGVPEVKYNGCLNFASAQTRPERHRKCLATNRGGCTQL